MRMFYAVIYTIIWPFFNLVHPHRAIGRERIPEGGVLVCGNHTSLSDPLFLAFAFHKKYQLRPMAKAELLRVPFIGWILKRVGVFGVERGKSDVGAIKQAMTWQAYALANSNAMDGMASSTRLVSVRTWYDNALVAVQVVFAALTVLAAAMYVLNDRKSKKQ